MRRSILPTFLVLASSLLAPAEGLAADPRAWALVVGVDDYPKVNAKGVDYRCPNATKDAEAVASWLTVTAGWPAEQVLLMTPKAGPRPDGRPTQPSLANLDAAIKDWLAPRVGPGDLVFVYFAGQAYSLSDPPVNRPELWEDPRDFLLPVDFGFDRPVEQAGWPIDRALKPLQVLKARVLCCLDTSTSGRKRGTSRTAPSADRLLAKLASWPGWAAWIAADNGHPAPDDHDGGPGSPFRDQFLRALGTPAGRNNLTACLGSLNGDGTLSTKNKFRSMGSLDPGLTLWSGRVEGVKDAGIKPILPRGHGGKITGLRLQADAEFLLSSSDDSTVRLWKVGSGPSPGLRLARTLTEPIAGVGSLALSPDGRLIAAASGRRGDFWLWDQTGKEIPFDRKGIPGLGERPIHSLGFLPDSHSLVTVDKAGTALIWDLSDSTKIRARRWFVGANARDRDSVSFATSAPSRGAFVVAALDRDGSVRLLNAAADTPRNIDVLGPGTENSAVELSKDGRTLAVGTIEGQVALFDMSGPDLPGKPIFSIDFAPEKEVEHLRLKGDGWLAVGTKKRLRLLRWGRDLKAPPPALKLAEGRVQEVLFSDDGRFLAAILLDPQEGPLVRLWRLADDGAPREITPKDEPGKASPPAKLAFSTRGPALVVGSQDGTIRNWTIDEDRHEVARSRLTPRDEGGIKGISPSPDGSRFVRIRHDGRAFLFDFRSRASTLLDDHKWNSLAFLPDGRLVGTLAIDDPTIVGEKRPLYLGGPVLYDPETDKVEAGLFLGPDRVAPEILRLDRLAVSRDGLRIVADRGQGADRLEAIFWQTSGGKLLSRRGAGNRHGLDRVTAFALAPSGGEAVVCTPGTATLHDGPRPEPQLSIVGATGDDKMTDEFSAVAIAPTPAGAGSPRRIALGTRKHGVVLWSPGKNPAEGVRRLGGKFAVEVETLTFTDDGRWLVASGKDKRFSAWELKPTGEAEEIQMEPSGSGHEAEIRDVRAWPGLGMVATAGDDATVRFWSLERRQLIGTLAFGPTGQDRDGGVAPAWVAYTPDGRFDCPVGGKDLIWLDWQGQTIPLAEAAGSRLDEGLLDRIRTAKVEESKPGDEATPPNLVLSAISPIAKDGTSPSQVVRLELRHDAPGRLKDLRLYRNGVPVPFVEDPVRPEDPNSRRWQVVLRNGPNTLRAVAGVDGGVEGSFEITPPILYEGPKTPSRLHVLAIGVDNYARPDLRLKYAVGDARDIGQQLSKLDVDSKGKPGSFPIQLLSDDKVDEQGVKDALEELKRRVDNRPDDKVVVFLAGHTEKFNEDFGLLLSKTQGGSILKYSTILQGLARLDAEQRLVIIDACQTDKLKDGKAGEFARRERWAINRHLLKYPTQYILASKAVENEELGHGLLSYALLCGLSAAKAPARLASDRDKAALFLRSADEDADGTITTEELNRYASTRVPLLAAAYPDSPTTRGGKAEAQRVGLPLSLDPIQPAFPLVNLPRP